MMATHDVDFALEWADEVIIFKDGKAAAHGSPIDIFQDPALLRETNLEQPVVLQLYDSLKKNGLLKRDFPLPRSLNALIQEIDRTGSSD